IFSEFLWNRRRASVYSLTSGSCHDKRRGWRALVTFFRSFEERSPPMLNNSSTLRIGVIGPEETTGDEPRGCSLWQVGYGASLTAAGATPVLLGETIHSRNLPDLVHDVQGLVWTSQPREAGIPTPAEERLCNWCRK